MTAVFRIGFAPDPSLAGQAYGSTLAAGRWHALQRGPSPRRVIYAAASRALAQLEKRVQAHRQQPIDQALYCLTLPRGLTIHSAAAVGLPADWRHNEDASRAFGDAWLDAARELALWVPSYVEPLENNLLINPTHPRAADIEIAVERTPFLFDPRLV